MSKVKWSFIILLTMGILVGWKWAAEYRNIPPLSDSVHKVVHVSFDDVVLEGFMNMVIGLDF